jgi:hypothetical protein
LYKEFNCTEPSPSVRVPWAQYHKFYGCNLRMFAIS